VTSVHDQAAETHQDATKLFDEHDESDQADRERALAHWTFSILVMGIIA
jgi:hypothetical protein